MRACLQQTCSGGRRFGATVLWTSVKCLGEFPGFRFATPVCQSLFTPGCVETVGFCAAAAAVTIAWRHPAMHLSCETG
jgi:hypothetical protein